MDILTLGLVLASSTPAPAPAPDPGFNWIGLIAALGGGAGIALMFERVFNVVGLIKKGVSARESKRKVDIVAARDAAIARADAAEERARVSDLRADAEWSYRRRAMTYAARLSWQLEKSGIEPHPWPSELEDTEPANPTTSAPAQN